MRGKKIILIILILLISIIYNMFYNYSQAISLNSIIGQGKDFIETGEEAQTNTGEDIETLDGDNVTQYTKQIYRIIYAIAVAITVIVSAIIGIKIMLGSVEEKAEIKEQLVPYIIGCIVIFASFTIWAAVMKVAGKF